MAKVLPFDNASVQERQGEWLVVIGGRGPQVQRALRVGARFDVRGDNPNRDRAAATAIAPVGGVRLCRRDGIRPFLRPLRLQGGSHLDNRA